MPHKEGDSLLEPCTIAGVNFDAHSRVAGVQLNARLCQKRLYTLDDASTERTALGSV